MTLDRTKKYKVGDVVFECANVFGTGQSLWQDAEDRSSSFCLNDTDFARLHPVEVEEPLKWSFEYEAATDGFDFKTRANHAAPTKVFAGNWRHEVVSTRIG